MSVIIRLQNLPLTASSVDIRDFFSGLNIPPGGVHIVGGKKGSAFIAFANDEDARQAMGKDGRRIKDARIKLALSSHRELKEVLEQLHKEQSGYEIGRKTRSSESRPERNRCRGKHKRSRSRSLGRSHQEFSSDNQNSGANYDNNLQRENLSMKQQSPYDRHRGRKVHYAGNSGREYVGASGNDKPNPYTSSTNTDPEEERNEEIRRHIEAFIATFGQAENYNLDLKKEAYPNKTFKAGHDAFPLPGSTEAVHPNRLQSYPSMQIPTDNFPPKAFDDFDTRRHFDDLRKENTVGTSEVFQGVTVSSENALYKPLSGQNERMPYGVDGPKFSSQTNHSILEDRLLNSPMDIEENKNNSNAERFQPAQYFGPRVFSSVEEMSKVQSEGAPVPMGPASCNLLPFQSFEHPVADLRLDNFQKGHPGFTPIDAAKDFCIKLEGLPYFTTENDIRRVFRDRSIFDMFIPYTSDGKASGIGFVQFSSAEDLLAVGKMKYCMIGEHRVEFCGSSRAALMEARISSGTNAEISSSFQDVLALKRAQDVLNSLLSSRDSPASASHPVVPPTYLPGSESYPVIPLSSQHQAAALPAKRSLCAVITGLPSHFTRHIQVLKCIENTGINFHLVHLVLNNRSRFAGKVFVEFHDLRDLDAALKKHNQNVEGCTIGVKQVLYEEMTKILSSHRSRCMYPSPKQLDRPEPKPEKAPYIWEPPYEAVDKPSEKHSPAVWSSERAMKNRRLVGPDDFYSQKERIFGDHSDGVQVFNRDIGMSTSHEPNLHSGRSIHQETQIDINMHDRIARPHASNSYSGFKEVSESFQVDTGLLNMNLPERGNQDSISRGERGFRSRKSDFTASHFPRDKQRERSRSPIDSGLKRDFFRDNKRFKNEQRSEEKPEVRCLGSASQTRHHHGHSKNSDSLLEGNDEFRKFLNLETDVSTPVERNHSSSRMKEASDTPTTKKLSEGGPPHKNFAKIQSHDEQSLKPQPERERFGGEKSSSDTSPKSQKKLSGHRKNCPKRLKRQKDQHLESEVLRPYDHPRIDDHPQLNNSSRSRDRTRPSVDHVRDNDRPRRGNRSRSNDHLKPVSHARSDAHLKLHEHSRFDDHPRSSDHTSFDDRSKLREHSRFDDRSKLHEHSDFDDRSKLHEHSDFDVQPRPNDRSSFGVRPRPNARSRFKNRPRPNARSRRNIAQHKSEQKECTEETRNHLRPEDLFNNPDCVLEATNVDPHVGLYELLDFFRGYGLHDENLIRRYTNTGEPTGDLRIAFHCHEDAAQAHKMLNRQSLKGRTIFLSFV